MNRTQVGIKVIGSTASVPENSKAKLMYYFDCMCNVLESGSDDGDMSRLRDWRNYNRLTENETDALLLVCVLLSPDTLLGKCIFQNDSMCVNCSNEFYELSAVSRTLMVSNSVVIDGQVRKVEKIMTFKMSWLRDNYVEPLQLYGDRLRRIAGMDRPRRRRCVIS